MKKEIRIYIVSTTNAEGETNALNLSDIQQMNDIDFMEEAEEQGYVWSLVGFQMNWNNRQESLPVKEESEMRIIEVEI